jgi:homoserine O-acetyltransferase
MMYARSTKLVIEKFGLASLVLVVSGSMGAQQAYEWVVRYPDMVKRAAPIAGTARNTIHDSLFTETLVEAITSGPRFNKGFYQSSADVREGLLRHAKIWAVMGWSTEFFQQNRIRHWAFRPWTISSSTFVRLFQRYGSEQSAMHGVEVATRRRQPPHWPDLRAPLARIRAKTFVMPMSSDMFFPPADCQAEWRLIPDAEFRPIPNHRRASRIVRCGP